MFWTKTENLRKKIFQPVDIASLAVFRILFGSLLFLSIVRFMAKGWVHDFYAVPRFFFTYEGFSWIRPWPEWGMYLHFGLLALAALCIVLGLFYRTSMFLFFLGFTYVELIDKTNYLNHYYFLSLLSFLLIFLPLNRALSLDVLRKPALKSSTIPSWVLGILRFQVGLVYFLAGVAKIKSDWLFQAQPLSLWLHARQDFPILGPLFGEAWVAYAMSWTGMIFDLSVPLLLLWRRSRPFAYLAVIVFHLMTVKLFYIGMFPWIMMVAALVFFPPDWPRKFFARIFPPLEPTLPTASAGGGPFPRRLGISLALVFFGLQILIPFRHLLHPGPVLWTEEGYRFSWNVMLMEKNGSIEFTVTEPKTGRRWQVRPREYLTPLQAKMMSTQPDMILSFARFIAQEFEGKGVLAPVVTAESYVALNGRSRRPYVKPQVDLARLSLSSPRSEWILPLEGSVSDFPSQSRLEIRP